MLRKLWRPDPQETPDTAPSRAPAANAALGALDDPRKLREELREAHPFLDVPEVAEAAAGISAPTKQVDLWRSEFGADYAERGNNRITEEGQRLLMRDWGKMLAHAVTPAPQSVLEVGCNIGRNLLALRNFIPELHGVEPNPKACDIARGFPDLADAKITTGDGFSLPYDDASIDLVFTSGVLIHIAPEDLGRVVDEIVRVSKRYVLCAEYFAHEPEAKKYHGMDGFLFKRDFGRFYLERHPDLRVLDYGFLWQVLDSSDDSNWWLFSKQ